MKRKTRFSPGGSTNPYQGDDIDPFSAVRDESGSTDPRQEGPSSEAFYDESTGKMLGTRRNLETGEYYSTEPIEAPKKAARQAPKVSSAKDKESGAKVRFGEQGPRRPGYELEDVRMRYQGNPKEYHYNTRGLLNLRGPELMKSYQPRRPEYKSADEAIYTPGKTRGLTNTAQIPENENRGESIGKTRGEQIQDDVKDNLGKIMAATGGAGLGAIGYLQKLKRARDAERALSKKAAKAFTKPQAREVGSKFSKGGSASSRADGIAQRGKTKGKVY